MTAQLGWWITREDLLEAIVDYIRLYQDAHRYPPSLRDITEGLGISSSSVTHSYLLRLRRSGAVTWETGKFRTLRVVDRLREQP